MGVKSNNLYNMEKLTLTTEQQHDLSKSLLQKIKEYFIKIFRSEKRKSEEELEDELISMTQSEEEKETLQEIMDEISLTYQKRKEFQDSGKDKDIETWQEEEIERIAKNVDPNVSNEDIGKLKEAIAKRTDMDIERASAAVEQLHEEIDNSKE